MAVIALFSTTSVAHKLPEFLVAKIISRCSKNINFTIYTSENSCLNNLLALTYIFFDQMKGKQCSRGIFKQRKNLIKLINALGISIYEIVGFSNRLK